MPTPALLLRLTDGRQLRAALAVARRLVPVLTDGRQLRAALAVAPLPELGRGCGLRRHRPGADAHRGGNAPELHPAELPDDPVGLRERHDGTPGVGLGYAEVLPAEPSHYVPGALRPAAFSFGGSTYTKDTIRVTDSLGTYRDMAAWWHATLPDYAPAAQALEVAIDSDGVAALYSGGELALTATGGTGPYTWDIVTNRSGCTLTAEGAYVAGPAVGIDRVRVTDSLGAVGLAQLEVIPAQLGVDMTGDPETESTRFNVYGYQCVPYAEIWGEGGTGPYTIAMQDNQTGATIQPAKGVRVALNLTNSVGAPIDLTGWTFEARLYSPARRRHGRRPGGHRDRNPARGRAARSGRRCRSIPRSSASPRRRQGRPTRSATPPPRSRCSSSPDRRPDHGSDPIRRDPRRLPAAPPDGHRPGRRHRRSDRRHRRGNRDVGIVLLGHRPEPGGRGDVARGRRGPPSPSLSSAGRPSSGCG